jgi:hypothetical protein
MLQLSDALQTIKKANPKIRELKAKEAETKSEKN